MNFDDEKLLELKSIYIMKIIHLYHQITKNKDDENFKSILYANSALINFYIDKKIEVWDWLLLKNNKIDYKYYSNIEIIIKDENIIQYINNLKNSKCVNTIENQGFLNYNFLRLYLNNKKFYNYENIIISFQNLFDKKLKIQSDISYFFYKLDKEDQLKFHKKYKKMIKTALKQTNINNSKYYVLLYMLIKYYYMEKNPLNFDEIKLQKYRKKSINYMKKIIITENKYRKEIIEILNKIVNKNNDCKLRKYLYKNNILITKP